MAIERKQLFVRIFIDSQIGHYTFYCGQFNSEQERASMEEAVRLEFEKNTPMLVLVNQYKERISLQRTLVYGYHTYNAATVAHG